MIRNVSTGKTSQLAKTMTFCHKLLSSRGRYRNSERWVTAEYIVSPLFTNQQWLLLRQDSILRFNFVRAASLGNQTSMSFGIQDLSQFCHRAKCLSRKDPGKWSSETD